MAKIIIVDDSKIFRKILRNVLNDDGHEVIGEASNGEELLSVLKTTKPELITLDITMPVMDGIEALKKVKETYPDITVIMVSAAGQKTKVMEALKAGAADFVQKPFDEEAVLKTINRIASK